MCVLSPTPARPWARRAGSSFTALIPVPECLDRDGVTAEARRHVSRPSQRSVAGRRDPFDALLDSAEHPQRARKSLNGAPGDESRAVDGKVRALAAEDDAVDDVVNASSVDARSLERKLHSSGREACAVNRVVASVKREELASNGNRESVSAEERASHGDRHRVNRDAVAASVEAR